MSREIKYDLNMGSAEDHIGLVEQRINNIQNEIVSLQDPEHPDYKADLTTEGRQIRIAGATQRLEEAQQNLENLKSEISASSKAA